MNRLSKENSKEGHKKNSRKLPFTKEIICTSSNSDSDFIPYKEHSDNIENQDNFNTISLLIRETSVYKIVANLKKGSLTSEGYFELVKVPEIYVSGAGKFLRKIRRRNKLRLKDIAAIVDTYPVKVYQWEKNKIRISLRDLIEIADALNIERNTIYTMIDNGEIRTKNSLPVDFDDVLDIIPYLKPLKLNGNWQVSLLSCPNEIRSKITEIFNLNFRFKEGRNRAIINSKELYNWLVTFFKYTKTFKIQPPLASDFQRLYENLDLRLAMILPLLQTDGSIYQKNHKIIFYGNSKILHNLFVDSMYFTYGILPTSYFVLNSDRNEYYTEYCQKSTVKIIDELYSLCGNTKTSPARDQGVSEYLKEPQPNLEYIINASETETQNVLRIWISAEGSITISQYKSNIRPVLYLGCAHPILNERLKQIANKFEMRFIRSRSKDTWSGIKGLYSTSIKTLINFLIIGGFINSVEISGNSIYHAGYDKDVLTLGILEYILQRNTTDNWQKKLPIEEHHQNINKILRNKEWKSAHYYITYYSG